MYASLTSSELAELQDAAYRAVIRLYDKARAIYAEMSGIGDADHVADFHRDPYTSMKRNASLIMAAARDAGELHTEILAEARERRQPAKARS